MFGVYEKYGEETKMTKTSKSQYFMKTSDIPFKEKQHLNMHNCSLLCNYGNQNEYPL